MKGKLRIALAISLLSVFLTAFSAEAAGKPAAPAGVAVGSWSACTQTDGTTKIDAGKVVVSGVRKYTKQMVVLPLPGPVLYDQLPGTVPATWTSSRKTGLAATWTSSPTDGDSMHLIRDVTYGARVYISFNGGFSNIQSAQFTFVAGSAACATMP